MKKILLLLVMYCTYTQHITAQNIAINDNGAAPDTSAMLDVQSTTKGFLTPRMTEAQRNLIPTPGKGLLVYQIDNDSGFYYHNGSQWIKLGYSAPTCKSIIPQPAFPVLNLNYGDQNSNIIASLGQIVVPIEITLKKITLVGHYNGGTPGRIKLALYTEDGQKKICESISDSISSLSPIPIEFLLNSPQIIHPGVYYLAVLPINTTSVHLVVYFDNPIDYYMINPIGRNVIQGDLPVTANSLPDSFDPTMISYGQGRCILVKFN